MKNYEPDFAQFVQNFFQEYLVKERGLSHNTIRSYRDTFVLLIDFYNKVEGISAPKLSLSDLNRTTIIKFMNWLEEDRHSSGSTRNQRFAAIRTFCNYMIHLDPSRMATWKEILSIRHKKYDSQSIKHLTIDAVKFLLEQIDTSTKKGRRDLALISLLYNAGIRVQELIDLTPSSIHLSKPNIIEVFGKGRKHRVIPLDDAIVNLMNRYMTEFKLKQLEKAYSPLFQNPRGEKLTTPGISHIINKYVKLAKESHPEYYGINVTPHVFRHSRAMHLLQSGVNLVYIRDILGHDSIKTTEIYAKAEPNHIRVALETAYEKVGITEPKQRNWEKDPQIKEFLKNFC